MTDKMAKAFDSSLNCFRSALFGADPNGILNAFYEDFSVPILPRVGKRNNGPDDLLLKVIWSNNLDSGPNWQRDQLLFAAKPGCLFFRVTGSPDLRYTQARDSGRSDRRFNALELVRTDVAHDSDHFELGSENKSSMTSNAYRKCGITIEPPITKPMFIASCSSSRVQPSVTHRSK